MKFADLNTTTEYAYQPGSKYGPVHKIRVRDAEKLWRRPRRWSQKDPAPEFVPARPGDRARQGDYASDKVGVLASLTSEPEANFLAMPAKILGTYADWEVQDAAEKEQARKNAQAKKEYQDANKAMAARLTELAALHPEYKINYVSPYDGTYPMPYAKLIQLLEALPDVQA